MFQNRSILQFCPATHHATRAAAHAPPAGGWGGALALAGLGLTCLGLTRVRLSLCAQDDGQNQQDD
jgi:hypothetical protein